MSRRHFLAVLPAMLVAGCGFQLRRLDGVPFASLYIDAPSGGGVTQRVRGLLASKKTTRLTATAEGAEAILKLGQEERSRIILSLSGAGRVTEYRLGLKLTYSIGGKDGRIWAAPETIELSRDLTYDDTLLLAKSAEEQLLYSDMESNAALRIVRRLQSISLGDGH